MANNSNVRMSNSDKTKIKTECLELFKEYVNKNILDISKECFDIKVTDYIYNHIMYSNVSINNSNNNDTNEKIKTIIKKTIKTAWCKVIPYRSYPSSHIMNVIVNKSHLDKKLEYLRNI